MQIVAHSIGTATLWGDILPEFITNDPFNKPKFG
jgi:hypothetical protein